MAFDGAVAGVTLGGSLLSAVSSFAVLVCFVMFNKTQRSFRHALVFNLSLSDFINAMDNSVSGIIYVRDKALYPGPACKFNGWLGQLSVQATDFSILAIGIATLLVVTQTGRVMNASTLAKTAMCMSVWVVPVITSTTGLALGAMVPVSGNWCWISADDTALRYALGHGWRFAIIGITIAIYTYIWWYITRHFKSLGNVSLNTTTNATVTEETKKEKVSKAIFPWRKHNRDISAPEKPLEPSEDSVDTEEPHYLHPEGGVPYYDPERAGSSTEDLFQSSRRMEDFQREGIRATTTITTTTSSRTRSVSISNPSKPKPIRLGAPLPPHHRPQSSAAITAISQPAETPAAPPINTEINKQVRNRSRKIERDIKKMLLLNGYPIMYVILWIPGITNRIMEATGHTSNNRALQILQASTQFIGFANALTYGLNQQWKKGK